ncbi:fluoride efflux transporter family protein [Corynebacterium sp. Q4381]|uniref:fluoride efflux transporter family protein n=1 Tax=Corynebacterium sp. Marseille-Q4381 TaxID=3121597 RepID=UPI002FE63237
MRTDSLHTGIAVGLGAALGALARYALTLLTTDGSPQAAVLVLAINMAGCFAMGRFKPGPFWGMGFLGGFTTYSAVALGALDFSLAGATIFILVTFTACVASWLAGDAASGGARRG